MNKILKANCKEFKAYCKIENEELKNIACKAMVKLGRDFAREYIEIEDKIDVKYYLDEYVDEILCDYDDWEIIKEYSTTSNPMTISEARKCFVDEIAEYIDLED